MQEITMQMGLAKQSEHEKQNEVDKLKADVKKLEKAKADCEAGMLGLTMQVQKDCDMITMFQAEGANARKEADDLKK